RDTPPSSATTVGRAVPTAVASRAASAMARTRAVVTRRRSRPGSKGGRGLGLVGRAVRRGPTEARQDQPGVAGRATPGLRPRSGTATPTFTELVHGRRRSVTGPGHRCGESGGLRQAPRGELF